MNPGSITFGCPASFVLYIRHTEIPFVSIENLSLTDFTAIKRFMFLLHVPVKTDNVFCFPETRKKNYGVERGEQFVVISIC